MKLDINEEIATIEAEIDVISTKLRKLWMRRRELKARTKILKPSAREMSIKANLQRSFDWLKRRRDGEKISEIAKQANLSRTYVNHCIQRAERIERGRAMHKLMGEW